MRMCMYVPVVQDQIWALVVDRVVQIDVSGLCFFCFFLMLDWGREGAVTYKLNLL